ncbi:hypothetical protein ACWZEH_20095 [Streptomyces sp. QTS137]
MGKSDLALPLSEMEDYGRRLRSLRTRLNHTNPHIRVSVTPAQPPPR